MFINHTFVAKSLVFLQVDQNAGEDFILTADAEFNAIQSLVLGRVQGQQNQQKPRRKTHLPMNNAEFAP